MASPYSTLPLPLNGLRYNRSTTSIPNDPQVIAMMHAWQHHLASVTNSMIPSFVSQTTANSSVYSHWIAPPVFDEPEKVRRPPLPRRIYPGTYTLDDGAVFTIETDGSWTLNDKDQKQRYRGNPERAFNRFVNASDIMEDFILFVRAQGISGDQIFDLPVRLFIMFLILQAEKQDQEDHTTTEQTLLAGAKQHKTHRCGYCGRFLARARAARKLFFCSGDHMDRMEAKGLQLAS